MKTFLCPVQPLQTGVKQNSISGTKKILVGNRGHHLLHLLVPSILLNGQKIRSNYWKQTFFSYGFIGHKPDPLFGGFFDSVRAGPLKIRDQRCGKQLFYRLIAAKDYR